MNGFGDVLLCENCAYCMQVYVTERDERYECRRYPPASIGNGFDCMPIFPVVTAYTWCGEHRKRIDE